MINVSYTIRPNSVDEIELNQIIESLPEKDRIEVIKLDDQLGLLNYLTGRLLLKEMLGQDVNAVHQFDSEEAMLPDGRQYNISDCHELVVCAISDNQRLGIGAERVRTIDLTEYEYILNEEDNYIIKNSNDKMKAFCRIWTQKESLLNAEGLNNQVDMRDIFIHNMVAHIKGEHTKWRLISFTINDHYEISLCHEWGKEGVRLRQLYNIW